MFTIMTMFITYHILSHRTSLLHTPSHRSITHCCREANQAQRQLRT